MRSKILVTLLDVFREQGNDAGLNKLYPGWCAELGQMSWMLYLKASEE